MDVFLVATGVRVVIADDAAVVGSGSVVQRADSAGRGVGVAAFRV